MPHIQATVKLKTIKNAYSQLQHSELVEITLSKLRNDLLTNDKELQEEVKQNLKESSKEHLVNIIADSLNPGEINILYRLTRP